MRSPSCTRACARGDLLGGPPLELCQDVETGLFELTFDGLGTLTANVS